MGTVRQAGHSFTPAIALSADAGGTPSSARPDMNQNLPDERTVSSVMGLVLLPSAIVKIRLSEMATRYVYRARYFRICTGPPNRAFAIVLWFAQSVGTFHASRYAFPMRRNAIGTSSKGPLERPAFQASATENR